MKKIFLFIFVIFYFSSISYANNIDFYGEKDISWGLGDTQISEIKSKIDELQNSTGLNTDIVILGSNDKSGCYSNPNFDTCVKDNYGYSSDIIIALKMKSALSSRGDIRSYMDNKNYPIIDTDTLKSIQDSITYNFGNNNFSKGIIEYYDKLNSNFLEKCSSIKSKADNLGINSSGVECRVVELKKLFNEYELKEQKQKESSAFYRNVYIVASIILFIVFMFGMNKYYVGRLNKLLRDVKYKLLDLDEKKVFKQDFLDIKKDFETLINKLEIYLANADKIWLKVRKHYISVNENIIKIKKNYDKKVELYNSQDELEKEIDDFININL